MVFEVLIPVFRIQQHYDFSQLSVEILAFWVLVRLAQTTLQVMTNLLQLLGEHTVL